MPTSGSRGESEVVTPGRRREGEIQRKRIRKVKKRCRMDGRMKKGEGRNREPTAVNDTTDLRREGERWNIAPNVASSIIPVPGTVHEDSKLFNFI
jgi:hypothetical protein